jgi:hypothetical protein
MKLIGITLFVLVVTFMVGSSFGWIVHWLLHTKLFKGLAKAHNVHHEKYTPDDFESEAYRDSGKDDSSFVFVPIITVSILLFFLPFAIMWSAWWIYFFVVVEGIIVGVANDRIHDAFHIRDHKLNKYRWFRKLKHLHWLHHVYPKKNQAIIWFGPDKLFRTFIK